ncbi:hypothetical protein J2S49_000797 [Arcanobacterium wilhelmae]|uniref:Uncharacterized protein n=1 Tax=Arcanobacterium wilhelmae TaxID=1803177 RepID=A0ABT9NBY2_9ACTO|nr:hypothetical protein [Arcanobacterium wilhelmae]MDP9800721.1 hypothetical protein [Arcanobacterium wilhelmae]WFN90120.1 hypothetical protein P8A24_07985 [Arcanobacterium wilhelmae]
MNRMCAASGFILGWCPDSRFRVFRRSGFPVISPIDFGFGFIFRLGFSAKAFLSPFSAAAGKKGSRND